jgi:hypothetical protein
MELWEWVTGATGERSEVRVKGTAHKAQTLAGRAPLRRKAKVRLKREGAPGFMD